MYKLHRPVARRALILSRYIIQLRRIVFSFTHDFTFAVAFTYLAYIHTYIQSIVTLQQILVRSIMSAELLFTIRDRKPEYKDPSLILANLYDEILRGHGTRRVLPLNRSQRDVEIYDNPDLRINSILAT
jgi:hypothetical protein